MSIRIKTVSEQNIEALTDRESGTIWLGRHIIKNGADFGTMYAINLLTQITTDEEKRFKRFPSSIQPGLSRGGRKNVAASIILRGSESAGVPSTRNTLQSGYTRVEEILADWAEQDGCWEDYADTAVQKKGYSHFEKFRCGSEANIFYNEKTGYCIKVIDISHYSNGIQGLLDKISAHNALFPELPYDVLGFGMKDAADDHFGYSVIVSQPFAKGRTPSPIEMKRISEERNFIKSKTPPFCTSEDGTIEIEDLHSGNAIRTENNSILVFDCDLKLARNFQIPKPEFSEESIKKIEDFIESIVPLPVTRTTPDNAPFLFKGKDGKMYFQTPERIIKALTFSPFSKEQKELLAHGKSVSLPEGNYVFLPDKGRIQLIPKQQKKTTKPCLKI